MIRLLLFFLLIFSAPAHADDFKPAYLQLTERDGRALDVLWKVPALDESTALSIHPVFPAGSKEITGRRTTFTSGATVARYGILVPGGLDGRPVSFTGNAATRTDILVRLVRRDGTEQLARLGVANPVFTAASRPGSGDVIASYTWLGIEHILTGFDHLLFVAALVLLVRSRGQLLLAITAFTVAHSITLALATLDFVRVPRPPVEAAIALSIMFVAAEIVRRETGNQGLATAAPWLVAFAFGLLHGLGFAGSLAEIGLPHANIPLALLFFNIGVELGQLAFVVLLLAIGHLAGRMARLVPARLSFMGSAYIIGAIAGYWTIERIIGLGSSG